MRVHVVSDVHGAADELARSGEGADVVVCLGDLLLFVDYADVGRGIVADLFGRAAAAEFVRLRTARRYDEASAYSRALWQRAAEEHGKDRATLLQERVDAQYSAVFAALPTPSLLMPGNVDLPRLWPGHLRPGQTVVDGTVVELGGLRFGFVGGGLVSPMRTPNELTEEAYAAKVAALGPVDVLCSHLPPAVPELRYDTVARRFEMGSTALLDYVRDVQPRLALFGHVHQPLSRRCRVGTTECVNVGHFRAAGTPYVLQW